MICLLFKDQGQLTSLSFRLCGNIYKSGSSVLIALTEIDQEPLMQESFIRHLQLLAIACQWNFVTCVFANLIDPMSTQ
jgi:hypothetical protein